MVAPYLPRRVGERKGKDKQMDWIVSGESYDVIQGGKGWLGGGRLEGKRRAGRDPVEVDGR